MSEHCETRCDICGAPVDDGGDRPRAHYEVHRYDQSGYYDRLDFCGPEHLAQGAVADAQALGREVGRRDASKRQPEPKRRWWQR